jgi:hypothetical protein
MKSVTLKYKEERSRMKRLTSTLKPQIKINFEDQFASPFPSSKNIALAGVIICSPWEDFENMDFYDLIRKISLLRDLQNEKKLIFIHIRETIQNLILSHEGFPVRANYLTNFQRMVAQLKKDKHIEFLEKRNAELEKRGAQSEKRVADLESKIINEKIIPLVLIILFFVIILFLNK